MSTVGTLEGVVGVHAQEAGSLYEARAAQLTLPRVALRSLHRLDDRLLSHFDGLAVAGSHAQRHLDAELEGATRGASFAAAVRAIESGRPDVLERLWALAGDTPHLWAGLTAAFGWVESRQLQGLVRALLKSGDPSKRS